MIFNIQRYSTHDGPGIRTVVFLKGCSLGCRWCQNPESRARTADLLYDARLCLDGCDLCQQAAPDVITRKLDGLIIHREKLTDAHISKLRDCCPTTALTVCGEEKNVEEIMATVLRDKPFYDRSGGGVTLSGGEPFMNPELARQLFEASHNAGIHTAVETCLHVPWKYVEPSLPFIDLFLADLKHVNEAIFQQWTDGSARRVLDSFAELARSMAATETRESRRDELLAIAENCDIIAHEPPKTFWQALQLCYFIQLILQVESNGHSVSFGRMDQYLYPYYRRDVELEQSLDREHAIDLLHCCWLKLLEVNKIRSGSHSKASAGSPLYQNVTIGGQNLVDGVAQDAVNPLSYAILESCGRLRSTQPNLSVRYHAGMSNDFLDACVQVIRCGFGMPAFNNDEIVIPEFIKLGIEPQDAYDYAAIGCIETAVGGKWGYRCTGMSFINFARVMLATLEGGRDATGGEVFLPQTHALSKGNFDNFDQVLADRDTQIRYYTRKSIEIEYVVDTMLEENVHDILCSALVDDCIERAKSIKQGGAKYDWVSGLQVGIANLGNSLVAVKKLVFDQGVIGQQQLAKALAEDFEGLTHEQLRQRLINGAPKYGNDEDSVDILLARAYQTYIDELKQYHNPRYGRGPIGGNYYAGTSSISANVPFGAQTMATPDGRKAHSPLAEGASPASGTDHLGPTAVISSVGKLPTGSILGGVLLNQKLNPATLENESDKQKLMVLLRTFFEVHKGWHIQYNIVSRETLLEAKKHPDQYRDLVVRVAGYSAFFTALSPDAQDDIFARTEHTL